MEYVLNMFFIMNELILHVNHSDDAKERAKTFGYKDGMLIQFEEGYLAKKCLVLQEMNFIKNNYSKMNSLFSDDLVVELLGTVDEQLIPEDSNEAIKIVYNKDYIKCDHKPPFYLLMKDLTAGYKKRCLLDIKIGKRCWNLGKPDDFIQDKKEKIAHCGIIHLDLRATGCEWFDDGGVRHCVRRKWGFDASYEEYIKMLKSFFRYAETNKYYLEKLEKLIKSVEIAEREYRMRFYSTSVLFSYDGDNPSNCDMRIIDFEKCYIYIDDVIKNFQRETIEDCEDGVLNGLHNLSKLISNL